MYDWPEVSGEWDDYWSLVATSLHEAGISAPARLAREGVYEDQWTQPNLLIGQTCGWPLISRLRGKVVAFARFDFALGGRDGDYSSAVIARSADQSAREILADPSAKIAINGFDSQSGFRALASLLEEPVTVSKDRFIVTGSHRNSVRAVASGHADIAAIDAVSWRLALRFEPAAKSVCWLASTAEVPGLPLITSLKNAQKASAFLAAMSDAATEMQSQNATGLIGVVAASLDDYAVLAHPRFARLQVADHS